MRQARFPAILLCCLCLITFSAGCTDAKKIPLFNPEAHPMNRVASANELITEANDRLVAARTFGWISQDTIDRGFSPALDKASELADSAELLIREGATGPGTAKIEVVASMLRSIRDQLKRLERSKS